MDFRHPVAVLWVVRVAKVVVALLTSPARIVRLFKCWVADKLTRELFFSLFFGFNTLCAGAL